MNLLEMIKHILYADRFVLNYRAEEERRNQEGIALISAAGFILMSFLNIKQGSFVMLGSTIIGAVLLIIGYFFSKYKNKTAFLKGVFYIIFVVIFTSYTIMGGNEGFAALWLIVATYAVMVEIDFKVGFLISFYYLVLLLLVFIGPLSFLLQYEYDQTFLLRFPFLYAINFAFATYIIIRIRMYQYELLLKQQELERISIIDLSTGLMNRNCFIQYEKSHQCNDVNSLLAIFIDVNGLHEINNREGHDAGDRMLCTIADYCKQFFCDDLVYRMGGDEFLILCKNVEESDVEQSIQRLLSAVKQSNYSISYGIEVQKSNFDLDKLVNDADEKMMDYKREYYKHSNRRNR